MNFRRYDREIVHGIVGILTATAVVAAFAMLLVAFS